MDGFKCRNLFRWLGYLVDLKVVQAQAATKFLLGLADQQVCGDLIHHCILVVISTENVTQRLKTESAADFTSLMSKMEAYFKQREQRCVLKQKALGLENHHDSMQTHWNMYQKSKDFVFLHRDIYLTLSEAKLNEIRNALANSPFNAFPKVEMKESDRVITFDSQTAKNLPPKRYQPMMFMSDFGDDFPKFMLHQLVCDMMFAFQENHKMAAQTILKMHVGPSLSSELQQSIVSSLVSYLCNYHDGDCHPNLQSQNSPKPPVFYAQMFGIL